MFVIAGLDNEPIFTGKLERLPWPDIEVPEYDEVVFGDWRIDSQVATIIRGYFRGLQPSMNNYRLFKVSTEEVYMSVSPMEIESQMPHVAAAEGHTVVVGGGMGLYLYNVLKKDSVSRVTLVEADRSVIDLIEHFALRMEWPNFEKLTIIESDIFELNMLNDKVDFLYVDIWPELMDSYALSDTQFIQGNLKAEEVGFWGQELEFISWMKDSNIQLPTTPDLLSIWADEIDLPISARSLKSYHAWCLAAAEQVVLY